MVFTATGFRFARKEGIDLPAWLSENLELHYDKLKTSLGPFSNLLQSTSGECADFVLDVALVDRLDLSYVDHALARQVEFAFI